MRKFTALLSIVAIAASALFVSCAQKNVPTVVPAFPSIKYATYQLNKSGDFEWSYESAYGYTDAKGGGFQNKKDARLEYVIEPNADWTATIEGDGVEYVAFRIGNNGYEGYDDSQYTHGATVDGARGKRVLRFEVVKTPYKGETPVEVNVKMLMCGQNMVIATFTIYPSNEEAPVDQPDVPAADYTIGGADFMGTITNWGDTYMNGSINYTIDLFAIAFDEESGDPTGMKMVRLDYSVPGDAEDASASNVAADNAYSFAPNTYTPGYFDSENQEIYGTIYAEMDYSTGLYTVTEPINDGVFSVSVAEGIYTITGELKSLNGKTIKVEYTGELDNANELSVLSRKSEVRPTVKHFFSTAVKVAKR